LLFVLLSQCLLVPFCLCTTSSADDRLTKTPFGKLPRECVHTVRSGSLIFNEDGYTRVEHPSHPTYRISSCNLNSFLQDRKRRPQTYDGWLAYTTYHNPVGFSGFLGYFTVPNEPQNTPEELYIFTGLQNVDWIPIVDPEPPAFDIIQPVLQYPGDNGDYWSVKSWYVTLGATVLVSDEIQVSVGDNIFGNMTRVGPHSWYIGGTSMASGLTSSLTVYHKNRLQSQPWAYNTLECYGCDGGCSYEPTTPVQFTKLWLIDENGRHVVPQWVSHVSPNRLCHEKAIVNSPGSVTIDFD